MDSIFRKKPTRSSVASTASSSIASPNPSLNSVPYADVASRTPPLSGPAKTPGLRRDVTSSLLISSPVQKPQLANDPRSPGPSDMAPPPVASSSRSSRHTGRTSGLSERPAPSPDLEGTIRKVTPDEVHSGDNGYRYIPPSVNFERMGTNGLPIEEFGARTVHPYARTGRDPDSTSIRSNASSLSQNQRGPALNRDLGRYPTFASDQRQVYSPTINESRTSLQPRSSVQSIVPNGRASVSQAPPGIAGSRLSEEFSIPRPPDAAVEAMFQSLLQGRDLDMTVSSMSSRASVSSVMANVARTTSQLPIDTKWAMVESDARARWEAARESQKTSEEISKATKGKRSTLGGSKHPPEWYLKKMLDGTVTLDNLRALQISIRSSPLE